MIVFVRIHCFFMRKLINNTALLQKNKLKLRSFNSQLHSALSVVGYHDRGQEIGKYCPLPEPIRLQDSQDTARSRSKKLVRGIIFPVTKSEVVQATEGLKWHETARIKV